MHPTHPVFPLSFFSARVEITTFRAGKLCTYNSTIYCSQQLEHGASKSQKQNPEPEPLPLFSHEIFFDEALLALRASKTKTPVVSPNFDTGKKGDFW